VNHKVILAGVPMPLMNWVHFLLEQVFFFGLPYLIYVSDFIWLSSRVFMFFQVCIHYFKVRMIILIVFLLDEFLLQGKPELPRGIS
jgi:hypothetical protein